MSKQQRRRRVLSQAVGNAVGAMRGVLRSRKPVSARRQSSMLEALESRQMLSALYWDTSASAGLQAGGGTWSASDVCWNTQADGNGTRTAWVDGSDAVFSASGTSAITVSGNVSTNSLAFNGSGYGISGGVINLSGGSVSGGATASISSTLTGTAGLTKSGAGQLVLRGSNSYTGGTTLAGGYLNIVDGGNIGGEGSAITFAGGILQVGGTSLNNLNGYTVNWSSFSGGFEILDSSNTFTISQNVTASSLTKIGGGTLILSGAGSSYATVAAYAGTLRIDAGTFMSSTTIYPGGTIEINGGTVGGTLTGYFGDTLQINGGTVSAPLAMGSGTVQITGGNVTGNITSGSITFANAADMAYAGSISGTGTVTKQGAGKLTLTGTNTYTGGTTLSAGALVLNSSLSASSVTVASGASLSGTGGVSGSVTLASGGVIQPTGGLGVLHTGTLSMSTGSILAVALNGNTLGTQYGQVSATGQVNLTGSTLSLTGTRDNDDGQSLVIVANDGTDPIVGTFAGLAEGATLTVNGVDYTISYTGGDGNDVVLTDKPMTVSISGPGTANEGDTLALTSAVANTPDAIAYAWSVTKDGSAFTLPANTVTNAPSFSFVPTDNGSYTVTLLAQDAHSHTASAVQNIAVSNVAPIAASLMALGSNLATLTSPAEGSNALVILLASDPSTVDTAAGLRYSFAFSEADLAATYADGISMNGAMLTFPDSGTHTLYGRVFDKDGRYTDYSRTVVVSNVAPTGTFSVTPTSLNEGSSATASFSGVTDPSSDDSSAGLHYSYALIVDALATSYAGATDGPAKSFPLPDSGSHTLYGRVFDKDGGYSDYSVAVNVQNVAPTGTFAVDAGTIDQGGPVTAGFTNVSDCSPADTSSGFRYSYALNVDHLAGSYVQAGAVTSRDFIFADSGSHTIYGRVFDKDNGYTDYSTSFIVTSPQVEQFGGAAAYAGNRYVIVLGQESNPAPHAVSSYIIHWGDGASDTIAAADLAASRLVAHTYATGSAWGIPRAITVDLVDEHGTHLVAVSSDVTVFSEAPDVSLTPAASNSNRLGGTQTYAPVVVSGDSADWTYRWTVTCDSQPVILSPAAASASQLAFTPVTAGSYCITLNVTDHLGRTATASVTGRVYLSSTHLLANATVNLGDTACVTVVLGSATALPSSLTVQWGDGTSESFSESDLEVTDDGVIELQHLYDDEGDYHVDVAVSDGDGSYLVDITLEVTEDLPAAPSLLSTVGVPYCDHVEFSWQDNADDEDGYVVEWSDDGSEWFVIDELPAGSTSYVDEWPEFGMNNLYRARAYRGNDLVSYSPVSPGDYVSVYPIAPPVAWYDDNAGPNERATLSPFSVVHDSGNGVTFSVVPNDIDYDSSTIQIADFTQPAGGAGTVTLNQQTGAFTFVPGAGFVGTATFTYRVTDGYSYSAPASVAIDVTNAAPVVSNVAITSDELFLGSVTRDGVEIPNAATDQVVGTDVDNDPLTYAVIELPEHGTIELDAQTGEFVYTANSSFAGVDRFSYTASDGLENSIPAAVMISGTRPLVWGDYLASPSCETHIITPFDPRYTYTIVSGPSHGTLVYAEDDPLYGTGYHYVPASGYYGWDEFTFTAAYGSLVTKPTVAKICHWQLATIDQVSWQYGCPGNSVFSVSDVGSTILSETETRFLSAQQRAAGMEVELAAGATHGTVTVSATGAFGYSPDAGYRGWDYFSIIYTGAGEPGGAHWIGVNVGDYVAPPPLMVTAPPAAHTSGSFDGHLNTLLNDVGSVEIQRNVVLKAVETLGKAWDAINANAGGTDDEAVVLAGVAAAALDKAQAAYEKYQNDWLELNHNAASYQNTFTAYIENWTDPDLYGDVLNRITSLPKDIGGLKANAEFLAKAKETVDAYGDAAAFQSNLAGTVFTTATYTHEVLEKAEYGLGLLSGGTYTVASLTTKAGLAAVVKTVARNYLTAEIAQAALTPVMTDAMNLAQRANLNVNPTYLRAGLLAMQATAIIKPALPKLNNAAKPFVAPLKSVAGKMLKFPGIKTASKLFTIRSTDETNALRAAFDAANGPKAQFLEELATNHTAELRKAGISSAQIADMKLGYVPEGFNIHHKTPLQLGGDNTLSNLILMQTGAKSKVDYHSALTNYQNSLTRNLSAGETFETMWPEFSGFIYP